MNEREDGPRAAVGDSQHRNEITNSDEHLVAENIVKRYQGVVALDRVSLTITKGEIVGLIGPNGSGKTTFLNVVSGVIRPTSGRVTVAGVNATRRASHTFARLGVSRTFQQIRLFSDMTVLENILVGAAINRGHARNVPDLLRKLKLTDKARRPATTLAYGDQRRVEIARALAGSPRFLLLDEPAAGMNEEESDDLLLTIRQIRDETGTAILIVDHDLRLIMRLCERIHVLAEGRTICAGQPDIVRKDPRVVEAYLGTGRQDRGIRRRERKATRADI